MDNKKRNTIQKELIINAVNRLKTHPTADEIYDEVKKFCNNISKGTVYRNLSALSESGEILRVEVANACDRFDFNINNHFHIECLKCGKVFDSVVECKNIKIPLDEDLKNGFELKGYNILFKGICPHCIGQKIDD